MQLSNEETATEKILIFTEIYFGEISIFMSQFPWLELWDNLSVFFFFAIRKYLILKTLVFQQIKLNEMQ